MTTMKFGMSEHPKVEFCMRCRYRGFTLIEVMVAMAVIAILAALALPAYSSYILRSKIPAGLDGLSAYQTRMEQRFQDVGYYGNLATSPTACALAGTSGSNFTVTCVLKNAAGTGYTATATGSGPVAGVVYTVDEQGVRTTVSHPKGVPSPNTCWTIRGASCDS
jgi:type IV pilus assembly protein PilE